MATPQLPTQYVNPAGPQPLNPSGAIAAQLDTGAQRQLLTDPSGALIVTTTGTSGVSVNNENITQVNSVAVATSGIRSGTLGTTAVGMGSGLTNLSVLNLGSGSQTFAADANRRYLFVANPGSANIGLKLSAAANGSASLGAIGTMPLVQNGSYTAESNYIYTGEFTLCGTSGGGGAIVYAGSAP